MSHRLFHRAKQPIRYKDVTVEVLKGGETLPCDHCDFSVCATNTVKEPVPCDLNYISEAQLFCTVHKIPLREGASICPDFMWAPGVYVKYTDFKVNNDLYEVEHFSNVGTERVRSAVSFYRKHIKWLATPK